MYRYFHFYFRENIYKPGNLFQMEKRPQCHNSVVTIFILFLVHQMKDHLDHSYLVQGSPRDNGPGLGSHFQGHGSGVSPMRFALRLRSWVPRSGSQSRVPGPTCGIGLQSYLQVLGVSDPTYQMGPRSRVSGPNFRVPLLANAQVLSLGPGVPLKVLGLRSEYTQTYLVRRESL